MPYRKQHFVNNEIYHIALRAIDKNLIFRDIDDYYRGIFSIYEFNNTKPVEILERRKQRKREKLTGDPLSPPRELLVEVLAFCIMPNHIHLLVKQIKNGGITKFMIKFGAGYGGYFNRKYGRKGHVFQNRFSSVHIKDEEQLKVVFTYIHTNPIALIETNWKEKGIKNFGEAIKFLENYKWSSYLDYIDKKNFPSVIKKDLMLKIMGNEDGCKDFIKNWLKTKEEINKFNNLFLDY